MERTRKAIAFKEENSNIQKHIYVMKKEELLGLKRITVDISEARLGAFSLVVGSMEGVC